MKKIVFAFTAIVFLLLKSYSQDNPDIFNQFRTVPDPFDKSRISRYLNNDDLNPSDYEGYYNRGVRNLQNGLFAEAIEDFRHVLFPVSDLVGAQLAVPDPYFFTGVCKYMLNEPDSAMYYFNMTLRIDPAYTDAYSERGILYLNYGDYDAAIDDFNTALKFDPASVYARYNLGYANFLAGETKQAARILKKVAKATPEYEWPLILLGAIDMQNNKLTRAEKQFTKAIAINREQPAAYFNRGLARTRKAWISYNSFQLSKAYGDFTRVTELDPKDDKAYDLLTFIDILQERPNSALQNKFRAAVVRFEDTVYRTNANPYLIEEYYLLNEIFHGSVSQKEKDIARAYFLDNLTLMNVPSASKIQTELLKNPASLYLKRMLIYHFLKVQNLDDIGAFLDEILAGDPSLVHLQCVKAELLQMQDKTNEGIMLINETIEKDTTHTYFYYVAGKLYFDKQNYHQAIEMMDKAISMNPALTDAYNVRCKAYSGIGEHQKALEDGVMLINFYPDVYIGYYLSGYAYNRLAKPDSALMMFDFAGYLEPKFIPVYNETAYSYKLLGKHDKIEKTFDKLTKTYGGSGVGHYYKGIFYDEKMDDTLASIANLQRAHEVNPNNKIFVASIGDFNFYKRENYHEAIKTFKAAIDIDPEYIYALSMTGWAHYKLEEYITAIHYYEKILEIDSSNVYALIDIGRSYSRLDSNDKALEFYFKATELDPQNAGALGNTGWCYYLLDDFENCIDYSKRAIALKSDSYYAMANIALSTLRLGRYDESLELYADYWEKVKDLEKSVYEGAITDLEDLIEKDILVEEAAYILKTFFGVEE